MLKPCVGCRRLVRQEDRECPFCRAEARDGAPAMPLARAARAAMIASVMIGGAACTPSETTAPPAPTATPSDTGALVAAYGAPMPPEDAGAPLVVDAGAPKPPPPVADAGTPKPPPTHTTITMPAYGMAPVTAYGAPPLPPSPTSSTPKPQPKH